MKTCPTCRAAMRCWAVELRRARSKREAASWLRIALDFRDGDCNWHERKKGGAQ